MELRHLRYFVTLAKVLHFGKAAELLNIAQPPLSRQIKQLEDEVGGPLFHRTKRHVSLNEAGQLFYQHAIQILDQVDKACEAVQHVRAGEKGQITIGFAGGTTNALLRLQTEFIKKYPRAVFILRRLGTMDQVTALHEKKINVGLLYPPVESKKINFLTLDMQSIVVALPSQHPLAQCDAPIDVAALANEAFIMPPREAGPSYHDKLSHICYKHGFVPKVVLEVYELEAIVSLVSEGLGISLVPTTFSHYQINGVVYKNLSESASVLETSLAWRSDEASSIVHNFVNFVRQGKDSGLL